MTIVVESFSERDLVSRVKWINHPSIANNMYFDLPLSLGETAEWYKGLSSRTNRKDLVFLNQENDSLIGMSGLIDIDLINRNAEFYVLINPDLQGNGFGRSITQWTINFSFLKYPLNKVYLFTDETNVKAYHLYEHLGFTKEGLQRQHKFKNGSFRNRLIYSILRSEWEELTWSTNEINLAYDVNP